MNCEPMKWAAVLFDAKLLAIFAVLLLIAQLKENEIPFTIHNRLDSQRRR